MPGARPPTPLSTDAIVREIYSSLLEHMSFERCLEALARPFRSQICALHAEDMRTHTASLEIFGPIKAMELATLAQAYATRWAGENLWMERSVDGFVTKGYQFGEAVVSDAELLNSAYYQFFLKPLDIRHGVGINLRSRGRSIFSILSLNRSAAAGPFAGSELTMIQALRPHLVNAYAIYRRIGYLQDQVTSLHASFDRMPLGMLVLDPEGRVLDHNEAASRLLAHTPGLCIGGHGRLRLVDVAAQARFRAALARMALTTENPVAEAILINGPDGDRTGALVMHLCALPPSAGNLLRRRGKILGFLCELNRHAESQFATRVLRIALNLTPMEAAVVLSLRDRHDPMHVALELGLAISTVRSHLQHVFRKSETTRQSELLRLVDRLLATVPC